MALTKVTSGVRTLTSAELVAGLDAGSIAEAKLADNAVTLAKMAHGTDGNLITYDASGAPAAVATGASGEVLTSAGAGAPPVFAAASASGEIIESVFLICNGSSQTVGSGTYTSQTVSAVQQLTASYADVNGSSITYTPPTAATRVIYNFHFHTAAVTDGQAVGSFKFFIGSDEVTQARTVVGAQSYPEQRTVFSWPIEISNAADTASGKQNGWSGSKVLKIQAIEHSSYSTKLHETFYWESGTSGVVSLPAINIVAIK